MIWLLALIMGAVSLIAGLAPLYLHINQREISLVGSGIIIGTAFIIVIPEGMESLSDAGIPLSTAGYAVFIGYMVMYIIDAYFEKPKTSHDRLPSVELHDLSDSSPEPTPKTSGSSLFVAPLSTTSLGMIIHSFADGIALGAASQAESSLQFIVLISILVHKGPAGFGFCTVLRHMGLPEATIKRDVTIFALAAPLAAVATNLLVGASENAQWWTGEGLLFSGGTFLFVAMHIEPDITCKSHLLLVLLGTVFPIVASFFAD